MSKKYVKQFMKMGYNKRDSIYLARKNFIFDKYSCKSVGNRVK
jgi:hypothetical protein